MYVARVLLITWSVFDVSRCSFVSAEALYAAHPAGWRLNYGFTWCATIVRGHVVQCMRLGCLRPSSHHINTVLPALSTRQPAPRSTGCPTYPGQERKWTFVWLNNDRDCMTTSHPSGCKNGLSYLHRYYTGCICCCSCAAVRTVT